MKTTGTKSRLSLAQPALNRIFRARCSRQAEEAKEARAGKSPAHHVDGYNPSRFRSGYEIFGLNLGAVILAGVLWLGGDRALQAQPTIITQPTDYTVCEGGAATFCVEAQSASPLSYQWRWYSAPNVYTNLPGATNACVVLTAVPIGPTTPQIATVVSDASGSVISRLAILTIKAAPHITQNLADAWVVLGQSFTFSAIATGAPPLTYQWYFNNQVLAGKTTNSLSFTSVQLNNEGDYHVVVSNSCDTVASATARLHTVQDTTFTRITGAPWDTDVGTAFSGATADYDGDGYLDLYVARYKSGRSTLYHNNGDGSFSSVTNGVFPLLAGSFFSTPWSDLDNDGRIDLFVAGEVIPANFLFNNGNGTFGQVPLANLDTWAVSPVDYDHDGLIDLYITSGFTSLTNRLYRNLGGRAFQLMTSAEVGPIAAIRALGAASWVDYDDDGWEDVCAGTQLSNAQGVYLFRNVRGRFVAVTNRITLDRLPCVVPAWGDFDNDGHVDVCIAASTGTSFVYRNLGNGDFERASIGVNLSAGYYSAVWADYDNDGFLDLLLGTFTVGQNLSLLRNTGNGTFSPVTSGPIVTNRPTSALSPTGLWFDYDNDGFLDLFVANGNDPGTALVPSFLYHNNRNTNSWLKVKLVGTVSNRDGAGAKVRMKATFGGSSRWQRRDVIAGGEPFVGGHNIIAHFGLGDATNVETLRVEWPSGQVTELHNLAVRQSLTITEAPGLRATGLSQGVLQVTAHPGMNIGLAVSSNLVDWVEWQTRPQTNRTDAVIDLDASQHPQRFYKARVR